MRRSSTLRTISPILLFVLVAFSFSSSFSFFASRRAAAAPLTHTAFASPGSLQRLASSSLAKTSQTGSLTLPLSSRSTFLHTNNDICQGYGQPPVASLAIDLAANGIHEHDTIEIVALGGFQFSIGLQDNANTTVAVFSTSNTLLDASQRYRVPGAIQTNQPPVDTGTTYFGNEPTDIPEDFSVVPRLTVTVPTGARFLFVAPADSVYCDNSDPNNDYAVQINITSTGYDISINFMQGTMPPTRPTKVSSQTIFLQINDGANIVRDADIQIDSIRATTLVDGGLDDGHAHFDPLLDAFRPAGTLTRISEPVGPDGVIKLKYVAPEVSGLVRATIGCTTPAGQVCNPQQVQIKVKIGGLEKLPESSSTYELIGYTPEHPANSHFGTAQLNQALIGLASAYAAKYPGSKLFYNDMSLPFGGLFDVHGNWLKSHSQHRLGENADLRVQTGNPVAVPPNRRLALRELAKKQKLGILIHDGSDGVVPHWHLTIGSDYCLINDSVCDNDDIVGDDEVSRLPSGPKTPSRLTSSSVLVQELHTVTYDSSSRLYTYQYQFRNDTSSTLEISSIQIPLQGSNITDLSAPLGWSSLVWGANEAVGFAATEGSDLQPGQPDDGNVQPSPFQIRPGQTSGVFLFRSFDPPGTIDFFAHGFKPIPVATADGTSPPRDNSGDFKGSTLGPLPSAFQVSAATYAVSEGTSSVDVAINRTGSTAAAARVDYSTSDPPGVNNCAAVNGIASPRCDFISTAGTVSFAPGETSKLVSILLVDDAYAEGNETFTVTLDKPSGATIGAQKNATITISDNDTATGLNPADAAEFFVRQHYLDFLNRQPDNNGLGFWINNITSCGNNAQCIELKRINVSAAFYVSIEFQQTGYLVERMYKTAYGDGTGTSTLGGTHQLAVPVVRLDEFQPDTQQIGRGVIVNQAGWEQVLENNKQAFAAQFVQRSRFATAFPTTMSPTQFVDALFANAGVTPSASDRSAAVNEFGSSTDTADLAARGRALRRVAENASLNSGEFNRAFVLMQYFGYLRRNPNDGQDTDYTGYDFWLRKLNQFNGNFQNAEMVKAFITSGEYRQRFGP